MKLGGLLRETLNVDCDEVWENERTPNIRGVFGVRLHSMGLSLREVVAVFEYSTLTVLTERSGNGRIRSRKTRPTRDGTAVAGRRRRETDHRRGEKKWL